MGTTLCFNAQLTTNTNSFLSDNYINTPITFKSISDKVGVNIDEGIGLFDLGMSG